MGLLRQSWSLLKNIEYQDQEMLNPKRRIQLNLGALIIQPDAQLIFK